MKNYSDRQVMHINVDQILEGRVTGNYFKTDARIEGAGRLKCGALFAGAGGFSLAAMNIGLDVKFAIEMDKNACDTYRSNLIDEDGPVLFSEDIQELSPLAVQKKSFGINEEFDLLPWRSPVPRILRTSD